MGRKKGNALALRSPTHIKKGTAIMGNTKMFKYVHSHWQGAGGWFVGVVRVLLVWLTLPVNILGCRVSGIGRIIRAATKKKGRAIFQTLTLYYL